MACFIRKEIDPYATNGLAQQQQYRYFNNGHFPFLISKHIICKFIYNYLGFRNRPCRLDIEYYTDTDLKLRKKKVNN